MFALPRQSAAGYHSRIWKLEVSLKCTQHVPRCARIRLIWVFKEWMSGSTVIMDKAVSSLPAAWLFRELARKAYMILIIERREEATHGRIKAGSA